jgi:hypothetical protein
MRVSVRVDVSLPGAARASSAGDGFGAAHDARPGTDPV